MSFTISVLVAFPSATAQRQFADHTRPFEPTEELYYEAEFSRSLFRGIDVAEFTLRSARTPLADIASTSAVDPPTPYALTFNADVASKGFFTRLFNLKFHERIESTVEPSSFTLQRNTMLDEQGKRVRTSETTYNRSQGKLSWSQRDPNNPNAGPRQAVLDFSGQLQDVLSAVYFIRTQSLQVGKHFEVFITDSGQVHRVPILVTQKKTLKTVLGKTKVIRLEPQLFGADKMIDRKGEFFLWLSDDERRVPIAARVKTEYGTFDIKLKRFTHIAPQ